jgi:hypothetical protein
MKNMHIPVIGEEVTLAEDWTFALHNEYRNKTLFLAIGEKAPAPFWCGTPGAETRNMTLEKGWTLTIDRIYIRRGAESFNSVTFKTSYNGKKVRFWAKLKDVNNMVIE